MEKEFVSYEQAVALKELGFNEICMGYFDVRLEHQIGNFDFTEIKGYHKSVSALSPLKQQVFRWFREKYSGVLVKDYGLIPHFTIIQNMFLDSHKILIYEEAEDDCIDKLIELAKQQS